MTNIRIVREFPHPPTKVWRALTEPSLMARWGMRPEGYSPIVGTRFKLIGKANPGWRGFVECKVLEVREARDAPATWDDDGKGPPTQLNVPAGTARRRDPARQWSTPASGAPAGLCSRN